MQKSYALNFDISRPGFLSGLGKPRVRAKRNSADIKTQVWNFAITSLANSTLYSITLNGITASFTTDSSATNSELLNGIVAAIRNSEIYDLAFPTIVGSAVRLTLRTPGATTLTATAVGFTVTSAVAGAEASPIPFGRFVARKTTDGADEARLPSADTDKLVGVTLSTYAIERDGIGQEATVAYYPGEMMDVLDRCNDLDGMWVEAVETDITVDDTLYVVVGGDDAGKVTKTASGNIELTYTGLVQGSVTNSDGTVMVLASVNMP